MRKISVYRINQKVTGLVIKKDFTPERRKMISWLQKGMVLKMFGQLAEPFLLNQRMELKII